MQNAKAELPSVLVIVVLVELVALGSGDENLNFDVCFFTENGMYMMSDISGI